MSLDEDRLVIAVSAAPGTSVMTDYISQKILS